MNYSFAVKCLRASNLPPVNTSHVQRITSCIMAVAVVLALLPWVAIAGAPPPLNQQLMEAAKAGDLAQVKTLLDKGADVNAKDEQGRTPLLGAAFGGHLAVGMILLERGADARGRSGIMMLDAAARAGDIETVKLALSKGADVNETLPGAVSPLMEAARSGNPDVLKLLLDKGADVNWRGGGNRTALMNAVWSGNAHAVRILLDKKANANAKDDEGRTALIGAARSGNMEVVRLLLAKGADVNAVFRGATFASRVPDLRTDSRTALNAALECGHKEIAELLRAHGAKEYEEK
jgi:uncharacterized protein